MVELLAVLKARPFKPGTRGIDHPSGGDGGHPVGRKANGPRSGAGPGGWPKAFTLDECATALATAALKIDVIGGGRGA